MAKVGKKYSKQKQTQYRVNDQIRIREVRVIGPDGDQIGVLPIKEAKAKAQEFGLDLVEIAPQARPPVCRILDFGKMRYDQTKKEKQLKKNSNQQTTKTVKMKPNIGENDLTRKIAAIQKFLDKGHRVVVIIRFKGREKKFVDLAQKQLLGRIKEHLLDATMDKPSMQGSQVTATIYKNS